MTKAAQHLHDSTVTLRRWQTTSDRHAKKHTKKPSPPPHQHPPQQEYCELPGQLQESFRPFRPEVSRGSVPGPENGGVSDGVSHGVCQGPFGPRDPECPKSVPRVSPSVRDTILTLQGHSRDTSGPKDSCSWPGSWPQKYRFFANGFCTDFYLRAAKKSGCQ